MTILCPAILQKTEPGRMLRATSFGQGLKMTLFIGLRAYGFAVSRYVNRPLIPIESMERFELVCYDLAGPFVPSAGARNLYALIIVDHFSKWPEIVPLTNIRAPTIANAIYEQ